MNRNVNEKKGKRKICGVWLVVALLFIVTMVPSVLSATSITINTDDNKIISDNSFPSKNLRNNNFFSQLFKNRLQQNLPPLGLFSSVIYTNCNGVEKSTEVIFGMLNDIDVDNNPNTGVDGADIRVQYILLPWIELDPILAIGGLFTISV